VPDLIVDVALGLNRGLDGRRQPPEEVEHAVVARVFATPRQPGRLGDGAGVVEEREDRGDVLTVEGVVNARDQRHAGRDRLDLLYHRNAAHVRFSFVPVSGVWYRPISDGQFYLG
jgi:hypothetical protein